ncbi:hypothetical protein B0H19DRAFT_1139433 [Mycena capillaripes]|nr:hypothetical protein B0H19DRAFT_1139433 [Mycena capillaripes]
MHSESTSMVRAMSVPRATSMQPLPLKGEDNGATCVICGVYLRRNTDLPRHMLTHSKDKESLMFRCPMDGCGHSTLQKSNLATHIRTHTRAKPHKCPEYFPNGQKCDFSTADPSSLHRHRKRKHGYAPRPKPVGPPRAFPRTYVSRREMDADGDAEGDIDAEGVSECESEESFGQRAEGPKAPARPADDEDVDMGGGEDDDQDGEGEPENETEPVLLSLPPSHLMNLSSERTEPPPPPPVDPPVIITWAPPEHPPVLGPPMRGLTLDPPAPVFANISDTRTYVDAQ